MSKPDVFVVSATRTAIGSFGGSLKDVALADLATTAVKAAIQRSGVSADQVAGGIGADPLGHLASAGRLPHPHAPPGNARAHRPRSRRP